MADISLVIINDDAAEYCPGLFKSISEQITLKDIDIVFIDNCSRDNSVQIAEKFGIKKIFRFEKKIENRGALYNKGFELTEASNIIFAHSDIYFASDFFEKLSKALKINANYEVICFAQYYADTSYFGNEKIGLDLENNILFYRQLFKPDPQSVEWLLECSEACFMVNRTYFQMVSFNESFKNSFHEFVLIGDIQNNGGTQVTLQDCKVTHYFIELHEKLATFSDDFSLLEMNAIKYIRMILMKKNYQIVERDKKIASLKDNLQQTNELLNQTKEFADSLRIKSRIKRMIKKMLLINR